MKRDFSGLILVTVLIGSVLGLIHPSALAEVTKIEFTSGPSWEVSDATGAALGSAQNVCLNSSWPSNCPAGATLYGWGGGGWGANLSSIPGATWIWAPGITGSSSPAYPASYSFSKSFDLGGEVTEGFISVAVDDQAEVFINGSSVGIASSQSALATFDIMPFLNSGTNVITVMAENGNFGCGSGPYQCNPAGVVFGGSITFDSIFQADFLPVQSVVNTATTDLIASKDTVVRVYVEADIDEILEVGHGELCVDKDVNDVCNTLIVLESIERADDAGFGPQQVFPKDFNYTDAQLINAEESLNFYITGSEADIYLDPGSHSFEARLYFDVFRDEPDFIAESTPFLFRETPTLAIDILTIPIAIPNTDPTSPETEVFPDPIAVTEAHRLIQILYPVDERGVRNIPYGETYFTDRDMRNAYGKFSVLKEISIRAWFSQLASPAEYVYSTGILPAFNSDGAILAPLGADDGFTVKFYDTVMTLDKKFAGPEGYQAASTTAHEFGHQFGLGDEYCLEGVFPCTKNPVNPPPRNRTEGDENGNYVTREMGGFDVSEFKPGRRAVYTTPFKTVYAFMGSAEDFGSWVSPAEYNHLFGQLTTEPASRVAASAATADATGITPTGVLQFGGSYNVIRIGGIIGRDGSLELDPFLIAPVASPVADPTGSNYRIEFRDETGALIASPGFDLDFTMEIFSNGQIREESVDILPFAQTLTLPDGTESIGIFEGETELQHVVRSSNAPLVEISSIVIDGNNVDVSWISSDGDGDSLLHTVIYSPDGTSVHVVGSVIFGNSVDFDMSALSATALTVDGYILVQANDGFNVSETRAPLILGAGDDVVVMKQYNTHGPNLPGMCSRKACLVNKNHTLVAKNLTRDQVILADMDIHIDAVPEPGCTVNSLDVGDSIAAAINVEIQPGAQHRQNIELEFTCPTGATTSIGQDFVLRAIVTPKNGIDLIAGNNETLSTQTVR
jgi:hypothetical protein